MYWSPRGGGIGRYLMAKHRFMARDTTLRHTIAVPGSFLSRPPGVSGIALPFSGGYRIARSRSSATQALLDLAPDAIEAGDPWTLAQAACDVGEKTGIPVSLFYHSDVVDSALRLFGRPLSDWVLRRVRQLARRMCRVRVPSNWMAERLLSWGIPGVRVQPLGVDTTTFRPRGRDPLWKVRHGLPTNARVAMYVGRFAPEKNLAVLARAIEQLGAPWSLVMVGHGGTPARGSRVLRLPYVADATQLSHTLSQADLFVHAGERETFGLAVLEAMACGVPGVGSAHGGVGELIDQGVGCAVPLRIDGSTTARAADEFAQAIEATAAREPMSLAAAARARAMRRDWREVLPPLVADHRFLMDRRTTPKGSHMPAGVSHAVR